jgi:hypothetical protein
MAFPHKGFSYLIEYDQLVVKAKEHTDWLQSRSWQVMNGFNSDSINPELLNSLAENKLGRVFGPILGTDERTQSS